MPRLRVLALVAAVAAALAYTSVALGAPPKNFVTPLSGAEEVPSRATQAHGVAHFKVRGDVIEYKLIASNIDNVIMAHIHAAPAGANGGIVVWLYPAAPPPAAAGAGAQDGVLMSGTITAGDLTGSLAGQPITALVDLLLSGNAYVNVHTDDGDGVPNSGPGDFPGGEIRGQVD